MKISFGKLLILFLVVPFVELYILLKIAEVTSPLTAFIIVIVTGVVGAHLAKQQGRRVINDIKRDTQLGRMPAESLLNGLCVLIGGILLLTPGVLTDMVGFLLIFPISRIWFVVFLKRHFSGVIQSQTVHIYSHYESPEQHETIDVEYETVDDDK